MNAWSQTDVNSVLERVSYEFLKVKRQNDNNFGREYSRSQRLLPFYFPCLLIILLILFHIL